MFEIMKKWYDEECELEIAVTDSVRIPRFSIQCSTPKSPLKSDVERFGIDCFDI